ncbi:MAG: 50S ribosomal protein L30 [Candidatus Borkfalkiaceae bacterium]|nr:50S ribosomal protein L30 [Christensenellaceae bacterium]
MANENIVKVTLVKSTLGRLKDQKATVEALGLHKIGQTKEFKDSVTLQGMLSKVSHLVKVEKN